ncbi:FAD/NAD(P)-binding protein [soil metagenome]
MDDLHGITYADGPDTRASPLTHAPAEPHIVIIGAGFSGTLLAINVLRHDGPRVTLIERHGDQLARGVAYSAADPTHLLNVRASNMSALRDDPGHLVRWLAARGQGAPQAFIPRILYGTYLQDMLSQAQASARASGQGRLTVLAGAVQGVVANAAGYRVDLADGSSLLADKVVLAVGNLPPHTPPGLDPDLLPTRSYAQDPWAADIAEGLSESDTVMLLGTGLTAIDAALLLDRAGFRGRILAMSRRGVVPRAHLAEGPAVQGRSERLRGPLSKIVKLIRRRSTQVDWRAAVDELRPMTQMMWGGADIDTRARFLRHLRPFWDVHRHRLAPEVADQIAQLQASGRLTFAAGKIVEAQADGNGVRLTWRPRGGTAISVSHARRVVNCTGPQGDLLRTGEPLLKALLDAGQIRPDVLRLGLDVDAQSRVVDAAGVAQERLLCIGPMTRGGMWEVVAVPDLRIQSWDLARRLSNAHWEGGEGL